MNTEVYPLYIAIDCSASMRKEVQGSRLIDLARQIPVELLNLYAKNNSLVSALRVSIIEFNIQAITTLPLSPIPRLRKLEQPGEPGYKTYFTELFREIRVRIIEDLNLVENSDGQLEAGSASQNFMKPFVLIVTDGIPSDSPQARKEAYEKLGLNIDGTKDSSIFPRPPQLLVFGVGEADFTNILIYDNTGLALDSKIRRSKNYGDVANHIKEIAHWLQVRVSESLAKPLMDEDDDWFRVDPDIDDEWDPWKL